MNSYNSNVQKFLLRTSDTEATRCWSHARQHRATSDPSGRTLRAHGLRAARALPTAPRRQRPLREGQLAGRVESVDRWLLVPGGPGWSRSVMHADETGRVTWCDFLEEACIGHQV